MIRLAAAAAGGASMAGAAGLAGGPAFPAFACPASRVIVTRRAMPAGRARPAVAVTA